MQYTLILNTPDGTTHTIPFSDIIYQIPFLVKTLFTPHDLYVFATQLQHYIASFFPIKVPHITELGIAEAYDTFEWCVAYEECKFYYESADKEHLLGALTELREHATDSIVMDAIDDYSDRLSLYDTHYKNNNGIYILIRDITHYTSIANFISIAANNGCTGCFISAT